MDEEIHKLCETCGNNIQVIVNDDANQQSICNLCAKEVIYFQN